MIVMKFGGTSVADAPAIARLADIIRTRSDDRPIVVVSALARVTDALLALGQLTKAGDGAAVGMAVTALIDRHTEVASALGANGAMTDIRPDGAALNSELCAALGRTLSPAELDRVAGRGELWSSRIVAAALAAASIDAVWVDIRPLMLTDARYGRASPDIAALRSRSAERFAPMVERGQVPVTQGFIGATADGTPTTLGRGGSDFTAALLGAAVDASRVEIWTDVNGLMTADPRIVPGAHSLAAASYEEAAELATFGAKVLHPATAQPLVRAGIPIVVLNSTRPEHPGTIIEPEAELARMGDSPVRSISWKKGISVVNIRAPRMLGAYGFLRQLFEAFERHETVVDVLASGEISVSITVEDQSRLDLVVRDLEELGEVWVEHGRAIVAVVGVGMRHTSGLASRIFRAVQPANVEVISQGASAINVTFVVRQEDGPDVVRRLHQEFFGA